MKKHCKNMGAAGMCLLLWMLLAAGCATPGPDYREPEMALPQAWTGTTSNTTGNSALQTADWWELLGDPTLTRLIQSAAADNLDLKTGLSRIREARLQRLKSGADRYPTLNSSGSMQKKYTWDEKDRQSDSELYSAGFDASWEADIFGGKQRSVEASQAALEAEIENTNDILVTLLSETAVSYIDVRTYQARLSVARTNVAALEESYDLARAMFQAGGGDELAVAQARYNLESSRAALPEMGAGLKTAMNRLAVLTGQPAGALNRELSQTAPIPEASLDLAAGAPADIIRRRPDIRRAERELAAQTARIGAAEAERFPKLTFGASLGLESVTLGDLISAPIKLASLGPSLSLPIFNGGALRANVEIETELQQQALLNYRNTVLAALEEVENALAAWARDREKRSMLEKAVQSARSAAELAKIQYTTGLVDFSDVLDAQRSLLSFEDKLIENKGSRVSDLVRLYKALGGGWQSFDLQSESNTENGRK